MKSLLLLALLSTCAVGQDTAKEFMNFIRRKPEKGRR